MVSVLGAVGLTAAYLVLRSFLPRRHAAFAIGCLALGPVSGTLGVSYMTDVPAFALEALALLSGLRALRTRRFSFPWFVASLLIGVAAFSIREYAVAAPAAVSIVALRRVGAHDRRNLGRAASSVSVGLLVAAAMYLWRHSLPGVSHVPRPLQSPLVIAAYVCSTAFKSHCLPSTCASCSLLGLSFGRCTITPARPSSSQESSARYGPYCGSANGAVLLGNYLTVQGSYPETLPGNPPAVLPTLVWQALSLLSLLSLLAFVGTGLTLHTLPRGSGTTVTRSTAQSSGVHLSWVFCLMMLGEVAAVKIATPESLLIDTSFRLSRSS